MEFFHFIKSPFGLDLNEMLHLDGQPTQQQWQLYADWWIKSKGELDDKLEKVKTVIC